LKLHLNLLMKLVEGRFILQSILICQIYVESSSISGDNVVSGTFEFDF
jgi:hypothetical protein